MGVNETSVIHRIVTEALPDEVGIPQGYKRTEGGVIPGDWDSKPLGALARGIFRGASPRPIDDPIWFDETSNVGWVRIADVTKSQRYLSDTTQYLSPRGIQHSRYLPSGALIMSICATVGRPIETRMDVCIHDGFVVFERPTVDQGFLYHVLTDLEPRWSSKGQTGSQMNLNTGLIKATEVAIPDSFVEQKAIAEALSDADALIESLTQLIAKKRALKQGAMQALLTGSERLSGFSNDWREFPFDELANVRRERIDPRRAPVDTFCVELEHIASGTGRLIGHTSTNQQASLKTMFQPGDVLFGKLRAYLRKYWCADRAGVCSTEIWCLFPAGILRSAGLLFQLVQMDRFIDAASVAYGTHMPRSDWNAVRQCRFLIPMDEEEQTAIAAVLFDMDAEVEALEARLTKTRHLKAGMMQGLLTGRFRLPLEQAT